MSTPITWIEKVTGVFVILILSLLLGALFISAQRHNVFGMYESSVIHTYLKNGYGIKKGSAVMLADVEIGVVNDIDLISVPPKEFPDAQVRADIRIEGKDAKYVYKGTVAKVDRQLIGGTQVMLIPPTLTAGLKPIENDDIIEAVVPESLMEKVASLKQDVEQIKVEVIHTLKDVQKTVENMRIVTDGLATGKGVAGRILQDEQMAQELTQSMADVRASIANVKTIMKTAETAVEAVPTATSNARDAAANVRDATAKMNRLMDEMPKVVASIQRTLADVEVLVANLREASGAFPEVARKTDKALSEANKTIQGVQGVPPIKWALPEPKPVVSEHEALPRGGPR